MSGNAIYQLPQDLGAPVDRPVTAYPYHTDTDTPRTKVQWDQHLISFLQVGQKVVHLNADRVVVESTHFLLLRAGRVLMTEHTAAPEGYSANLFFFTDEFLADFKARHHVPPVSDEPPAYLVLPYDEFTRHFARGLSVAGFSKSLLPLQAEELLLYLVQTFGPEVVHFFRPLATPREARLRQVVQQAVHQRLAVEEMAFLCHLSLSTFKREFARLYGTTPQRYLQHQRLDRAGYLLREEGRRPSDIYLEVGFENFSAFTQAFKRQFGLTPRQYREVNV